MRNGLGLADIQAAQERLRGVIHATPMLSSTSLSELGGMPILFKSENMQKTGSFKIRGAYNRIAQLGEEERRAGVITASSGNHGCATSYAAMILGLRAVIVMPEKAVAAKRSACEAYGAELHFVGQTTEERLAYAQDLAAEQGLVMIHPYDDHQVMAGQGTIGLEILEQCPEVEQVVVQIGGGGLLSGIATALRESGYRGRIVGVEPAVSPRMAYAQQRGGPTQLEEWSRSVADGINSNKAGALTYPIICAHVDELVTVSEAAIVEATRLLVERGKTFVEPSGAATFAAALEGKLHKGLKTVCIVSGGNTDLPTLAALR